MTKLTRHEHPLRYTGSDKLKDGPECRICGCITRWRSSARCVDCTYRARRVANPKARAGLNTANKPTLGRYGAGLTHPLRAAGVLANLGTARDALEYAARLNLPTPGTEPLFSGFEVFVTGAIERLSAAIEEVQRRSHEPAPETNERSHEPAPETNERSHETAPGSAPDDLADLL